MSDITALKEAWQIAERAAADAKQCYEAAVIATCPFQMDDIIQATDGTLAKVIGHEINCWGAVAPRAVFRRSDKSWGDRQIPSWRHMWKQATLYERQSDAG